MLEAAPKVFKRGNDRESEHLEQERDRLYRKVGQLQVEVDWLKKDRFRRLTVQENKAMIEPGHLKFSIRRQCELLGLPPCSSGSYVLPSQEDLQLMRLIDEEYTRHPFYGTPKMRE